MYICKQGHGVGLGVCVSCCGYLGASVGTFPPLSLGWDLGTGFQATSFQLRTPALTEVLPPPATVLP